MDTQLDMHVMNLYDDTRSLIVEPMKHSLEHVLSSMRHQLLLEIIQLRGSSKVVIRIARSSLIV